MDVPIHLLMGPRMFNESSFVPFNRSSELSQNMVDAYDSSKAEAYWSHRLAQTNQMTAVLSFTLPDYLNRAYSEWEITTVVRALPDVTGLHVLDVGCGVGRVTVPL